MKLAIALSLLLPLASSETVLDANPLGCIDPADYDADTDFFPDKFVPHSTTDYITVDYHKTYKVVTNKFAGKSYLLYQCGTTPPAEEVASGEHHIVLPVPHGGGVAVTETPQIASLELLALRGEIRAYVGNPGLVSSPCLNHLMDEGGDVETIYFPEDPYNTELNRQGAADFLARNPDAIVLAGPWGNMAGERHVADTASEEKTAVATFDWLGLYAALFNLEGKANEIIADTESRYQCSADNAAALTADVQQDEKPKVLWAEYFEGDGWSIGKCPTPDAAYYCEFANHCGAEIINRPEDVGRCETYGGTTCYWYLSDEEFLELGKDAEVWVYPSKTFEAVYYEKKEVLDQFKSVQNESVYDNQGQGPNGWFEQRLAEYDVVALDMCTLVKTNNPDSIHQRRWFRNYFKGENIGSAGSCNVPDEIQEAWVPAQAKCTLLGVDPGATRPGVDGQGLFDPSSGGGEVKPNPADPSPDAVAEPNPAGDAPDATAGPAVAEQEPSPVDTSPAEPSPADSSSTDATEPSSSDAAVKEISAAAACGVKMIAISIASAGIISALLL